jgi:hypothetical protein
MAASIRPREGSTMVGPLHPLDIGTVTFDKPGTYEYHGKEYPWECGEVIVVPAPSGNNTQGH